MWWFFNLKNLKQIIMMIERNQLVMIVGKVNTTSTWFNGINLIFLYFLFSFVFFLPAGVRVRWYQSFLCTLSFFMIHSSYNIYTTFTTYYYSYDILLVRGHFLLFRSELISTSGLIRQLNKEIQPLTSKGGLQLLSNQ